MLTTCFTLSFLQLLHVAAAVTDDSNSDGTTVDPVVPVKATRMKNGESYITLHVDKHWTEWMEVVKPISVNFPCVLEDFLGGKPDTIQGSWEKDGVQIPQSKVTVQLIDGKYNLTKEFFVEHLGNYSCVFYNATGRVVKTFIVTGPAMKELRSKPIVGYAGDSTVLTCKIYPAPLSWLWYKVNGSEKEVVNTTVQSAHYKVMVKDEEVLLVVMSLTEEDSGSYLCVAHYPISPVEGVVHLKIITFMEPLKPFLVILTEVLLLVSLIAVCELRGRRSTAQADMATSENGMHVTEVEKPKLEERNGTEETATRQRKV